MNDMRNEYPRPSMKRDSFISLNGRWHLICEEAGLDCDINVPFCPESELSGIGYKDFMKHLVYTRLENLKRINGKRLLLHFDGVDYQSKLFVNDSFVGEYFGGQTAFYFDITDFITDGENKIELDVIDDLLSGRQPAGKQSTKPQSYGCVYTRTTGIYRPIWLEYVPEAHITRMKLMPDVDSSCIDCVVFCENASGKKLNLTAFYEGKEVGNKTVAVKGKTAKARIELSELHLWEIGCGRLYDIVLTLESDRVTGYFGMRSVYVNDGGIYINNKPAFMRLVLDQGYYDKGVMTPPDIKWYQNDIEAAMRFGFNGARYHQRTPEDTYLYEADKAGFIVHLEFGNTVLDLESDSAWKGIVCEWQETVLACYNHPSVIAYCPLNETKETRQGTLVRYLYDLTRAIDAERPIFDVSGFFHEKGVGDIEDSHDYHQEPSELEAVYRPLIDDEEIDYMLGHGKPTMVSEYGGCRYGNFPEGLETYGYGNTKTEDEFVERFRGLTLALLKNPKLKGFCYTQLYDIEQERNGLLTYEREYKLKPELLYEITTAESAWEKSENEK